MAMGAPWGRVFRIDAIVVLQWGTSISAADARVVHDKIVNARREARRRIVMVVEIQRDTPMPDLRTITEFFRTTRLLSRESVRVIGVLPPNAKNRRLIAASWSAFSAHLPVAVDVTDTLESALECAAATLGLDPANVLADAQRSASTA